MISIPAVLSRSESSKRMEDGDTLMVLSRSPLSVLEENNPRWI